MGVGFDGFGEYWVGMYGLSIGRVIINTGGCRSSLC